MLLVKATPSPRKRHRVVTSVRYLSSVPSEHEWFYRGLRDPEKWLRILSLIQSTRSGSWALKSQARGSDCSARFLGQKQVSPCKPTRIPFSKNRNAADCRLSSLERAVGWIQMCSESPVAKDAAGWVVSAGPRHATPSPTQGKNPAGSLLQLHSRLLCLCLCTGGR